MKVCNNNKIHIHIFTYWFTRRRFLHPLSLQQLRPFNSSTVTCIGHAITFESALSVWPICILLQHLHFRCILIRDKYSNLIDLSLVNIYLLVTGSFNQLVVTVKIDTDLATVHDWLPMWNLTISCLQNDHIHYHIHYHILPHLYI